MILLKYFLTNQVKLVIRFNYTIDINILSNQIYFSTNQIKVLYIVRI